ncbi:MAG: MBL fold metallo-hydrolase [Saprospiraceae bacterium]|nr:MBL fold metallo-hydrolase [Saprospiraceae bacterium]
MKIVSEQNGITIFESALYRTCAAVIELGNTVMIVDPNWLPDEVAFIAAYVGEHYWNHSQYLLFTHSDYDHIIGYGAFPKAKVIASAHFKTNPEKVKVIKQIIDFDFEYYINRTYPIIYPKVDILIEENGQMVTLGKKDIIFYHASGHCRDGLFAVIPDKKCWIAGDYFSNIEIPFVDYDYQAYLQTVYSAMDILKQYPLVELMITGHGDPATSRTDIEQRIQRDIAYLELIKTENVDEALISQCIRKYNDNPTMWRAHKKNLEMALRKP